MKKMFRVVFVMVMVVSLSFLAAGCSKKKVQSDTGMAPAVSTSEEPMADRGIQETGMAAEPESLDTAARMDEDLYPVLEGRTSGPMLPIYFDFDRSNIREDQRGRVEGNADFLAKNSRLRVRVEGNCDERGTNEYNMALGQRRAQSTKKYLVNLGVNAGRVETITYGEEKPLLFGHDEYSWAQNRRVDFVVVK